MIFRCVFAVAFLCVFFLKVNTVNAAGFNIPSPNAASLTIPSPQEYSSFLIEPWKANAPVVVIFTDPFCPYCIQALKRKDELKPYNAFVFWYPIFGERSDRRVAEIFQCNAVASEQVISAVIAKKSPGCTGEKNEHLMALNKAMYELYEPQGVPSYYFGGVSVSVAQLKEWRESVRDLAPSVAIDWPRYELNRLDTLTNSLSNVIVVLPQKYENLESLIQKLQSNAGYKWYFFTEGSAATYKKTCQHLVGKCELNAVKEYLSATQEIKLLYGLTAITKPVLIMNGKILSEREKEKYFDVLKDVI